MRSVRYASAPRITRSAMAASSSEIAMPVPATRTLHPAVILNEWSYLASPRSAAKFARPTNCVRSPKASCSWKEYQPACTAGQKKKTMVTAICGATSAYGSQVERKTTRFSTWEVLLVGRFEPAENLVPPAHRVVHRRLRVLASREHGFHLLLDHFAALDVVAKAKAPGVFRRRLVGELLHRELVAGVLLVEPGLLRQLVGGHRDRHVPGARVPVHLDLGLRQEAEELRHALVVGRGLLRHDPERCPADDRVLRGALHVVVIGDEVHRPGEFHPLSRRRE